MNYFAPLSHPDIDAYNKNWGWFFLWGVALVLLGLTAIYFSTVATVVSVIFLGALLAIAGVFVFFDTFQFWWGRWGGFTAHLIIGLLYAVVGIMLIQQPVVSSISITLLLGVFYVFLGIFRLIYPLTLGLPQKGWRVFNGLITLLLGILILAEWPMSGLFIIGLFIGIDLLIVGAIYTGAALSARNLLKPR